MSGHSKWATTKRKKAIIDSKRGKLFTKYIREIIVAARDGGGDINSNARLRTVVEKAKAINMPADNIKRAIQKGTGDLEGANYEEVVYEGYGPAGCAVIVEVLTDNKNRAAAEVRNIFTKGNGNMGEPGSVGWMFKKKGLISVPKTAAAEDDFMTLVLDAGAEDMTVSEEAYEVTTALEDFDKVQKALAAKSITATSAELTMLPSTTVKLTGKDAAGMLRLMEALEDNDDVQNVYANFDISEEEMDALG
jgi:YebC/PmpR family DNA-binding regulatory protein